MNDFESKILEHQTYLYKFALKLTHNREDAKDLVQDTLLKAIEKQNYYNSNLGKIQTWLCTILKNEFINKIRKDKIDFIPIKKLYYIQDQNELPNLYDYNFIHKILRPELIGFLQGFSYKELAKKLNKSIGTIKSRIFHQRKKLMKLLN